MKTVGDLYKISEINASLEEMFIKEEMNVAEEMKKKLAIHARGALVELEHQLKNAVSIKRRNKLITKKKYWEERLKYASI